MVLSLSESWYAKTTTLFLWRASCSHEAWLVSQICISQYTIYFSIFQKWKIRVDTKYIVPRIILTLLVVSVFSWNFDCCILHKKGYLSTLKTQYRWKKSPTVPFLIAGHILSWFFVPCTHTHTHTHTHTQTHTLTHSLSNSLALSRSLSLSLSPLSLSLQSPVAESEPRIEWGPCHIDLGREASIMHGTLSAQLKSIKLSEESLSRIKPLCTILDQLTRASEEEEGDPFSSTFEALRVMQSTISKFNSNGADAENSDSSSEYTTPAESQTTSPNHEQSPPPPYITAQTARATIGSAIQILNQNSSSSEQSLLGGSSSSPSTSPTHSGGGVSRLATHSHIAGGASSKTKTSPTGGARESIGAAIGSEGGVRRLSDSELQRHRVKPRVSPGGGGMPLPLPSHVKSSHNHSRSIDETMKWVLVSLTMIPYFF